MSVVGAGLPRLEGRDKVTGAARYAAEHPADGLAYAWIVGSTVAKGRVASVDDTAARAAEGVLTVLHHGNAERLGEVEDGELSVLQSAGIAYRGQAVALVVAETPEAAREAAALVRVRYDEQPHDVELSTDPDRLYTPETVNPAFPSETEQGDVDEALERADVVLDAWYATPGLFNNPMEPHASTATWRDGRLVVHDSTQGTSSCAQTLTELFGLDDGAVRVLAPHVGGGFGSKGSPRPNVVLACMAARATGRPVQLSFTRQMMFSLAGYRTPTIQRVRLGATRDGRLTAIEHLAHEHTSTILEFAEQTAVATRHMYAAPHRRTGHRLAKLDVPTPRWMRAPGECPGMYALESAMDELAQRLGMDPIELRIANEPDLDPDGGRPFSSRNLVACLREGADRFGWSGRAARREGRWLVGTGVAASTYPAMAMPSSATARREDDGTFTIRVNATDIGTGARTALWQIAAEALGVEPERVAIAIGDSDIGQASVAGGSSGTASWGWAVTKACRQLLDGGMREVTADTSEELEAMKDFERSAYGAQFAEARVDLDSGEIRVPRMLGVFAAGRIINPRTARSQLIGGMTMGLSMALHEEGHLDPRFGDYGNHDLATYHVAACADVTEIEVDWLPEQDGHLNPMGTKGIGEIGIVGAAAAVANAVAHATGIRVRDLPIQPDKLLADLPQR